MIGGALNENRDWAAASVLLDLWKAFEQILHSNLIKACDQHRFPVRLAKLQVWGPLGASRDLIGPSRPVLGRSWPD